MGHKVHPKAIRMATIYSWDSKWFSAKHYREFLRQDILIREFLKKLLAESGINNITIERSAHEVVITIFAAKPGLVIGRGGAGVEDLRKKIQTKFFKKTGEEKVNIKINIQEIGKPSLSSAVVLYSLSLIHI